MQDKLSREDFVLERFPDELLHELEKKEIKEEAEKEKIKAKEEGIKEGRKEYHNEIVLLLKQKGMSEEEIKILLNDK